MKYINIPDLYPISNALNFSTPDCHIVGGCDVYSIKPTREDKKFYKGIEDSLESQYESLVRLSASLSPPYRTRSEDGRHSETNSSRRRAGTAEPVSEIDLSRASPFGSLSQQPARRAFAYMIATLNASHPDYEFSSLRPSNFRKERSLRSIMHNIDSTLQHLRPRQTSAANYLSPPSISSSAPSPGLISEVWNQSMWKLLDKEMNLRQCERYSYAPDDDPFDGDEGSLWSIHYFFFSKEKRRVCYLYLRGFSVISHSPVQAALSVQKPKPAQRKVSSLSVGEGAGKRASFWLSSDLLSRSIDTVSYGEDDDDEMVIAEPGDDEVEVPYMDLDEIRSELINGTYDYAIDEESDEYNYDADDSWREPHRVRGVSEEICAVMEIDH